MLLRASILVAFGVAIAAADEVHLANCMNTGPGRPADEYSVIAYYASGQSTNQGMPSSNNLCFPVPSGTINWEAEDISCRFPTGVPFSFDLDSGAASAPNFSLVGGGTNTFTNFNCYKDNGHELYVDQDAKVCFSLYYCLG